MNGGPVRRGYRAWLPETALEGCVADHLLEEATQQWSAKWFARLNVRPLAPITSSAVLAGDVPWMVLDEDLAIAIPHGSRAKFAAMMLGVPADWAGTTEADLQVTADLSTTCLDDLARRCAQAFRLPAETRWHALDEGDLPAITRPRTCEIGVRSGEPLLRIVIGTELMVGLVKAAMPILTGQDPLQPVAMALGAQEVTIAASIGQCALTLSDMAGLTEGDVLIFDQDTGGPLSLALDGGSKPVGRCTVGQEDGHLHLKLLEPLFR
jgi:hypothetical protein